MKLERLRAEDLSPEAAELDRLRVEDSRLGGVKLERPLGAKLRLLPDDCGADLTLGDQLREEREGCERERPDDQLRDALDDRLRDAPDDRPLEESLERAKAGAANRMATTPRAIRPRATRRPVAALGTWGWGTDMILSLVIPAVTMRKPPHLHDANSVPIGRNMDFEVGRKTITYSISDGYKSGNTSFCVPGRLWGEGQHVVKVTPGLILMTLSSSRAEVRKSPTRVIPLGGKDDLRPIGFPNDQRIPILKRLTTRCFLSVGDLP